MSRLGRSTSKNDPALVNLYRVAAECIIFNMAALTPFRSDNGPVAHDWGRSFDRIFPTWSLASSPFLGGFQEVYRIMFRINLLLPRLRNCGEGGTSGEIQSEVDMLTQELDRLDCHVSQLYLSRLNADATSRLYRAKYFITSHSLRIHLTMIREPSSDALHPGISSNLAGAIALLKQINIFEPGNIALQWPLTILACAAEADDDFRFVTAKMREVQTFVDPANSRKLATAAFTLVHSRGKDCSWFPHIRQQNRCDHRPRLQTLEFLRDPRDLDEPASGE